MGLVNLRAMLMAEHVHVFLLTACKVPTHIYSQRYICINLLRLQYSLLKFTTWTCIEPCADSTANFFYTVQGKRRDQYTQEFDNKYNNKQY